MLNSGGGVTPWDATSGAKRAVARRVTISFKNLNMLASRETEGRGSVLNDCNI